MAQRANISPTWYTWLEQGRGGAPSADVLDRIARALMLTDLEREHLFLLGLGRPPEARYRKNEGVTPRLQRVLDALDPSPALIRTATWDVVAWNRAATVMLADYGALPPRAAQYPALPLPRSARPRGAIRLGKRGAVRGGRVPGGRRARRSRGGSGAAGRGTQPPQPRVPAMWRDNEVRGTHGEAVKHIRHPVLGPLAFEYSAFAVDGRTDLSMVVYNPATPADAEKISALGASPGREAI